MQYIAVFNLKNSDTCKVEYFERSTDDLAREVVKEVVNRLESKWYLIVTGAFLYVIDRSVQV